MKTQNTPFFEPLDVNDMGRLVKEVKETVATQMPVINHKYAFGVVDLWKLERARKSRIVRRHLVA